VARCGERSPSAARARELNLNRGEIK